MPLAKHCTLTCVAGEYPDKAPEGSIIKMTVEASIEILGLSVVEFNVVRDKFKLALANTISCSVDKINITNVTNVSRPRTSQSVLPVTPKGNVKQRRLQEDTLLDIKFEISVSSANDMDSALSSLQGTIFVISSRNNPWHSPS
jgi:hypothetical protein